MADESNILQEVLKKQREINEKANTERENIIGDETKKIAFQAKMRGGLDRMRMADVKTAIDNKKKAAAAEEALLLQTANNLGVTVDELKSEYKSISIDPADVNQLIFQPFENLSKSLTEFEVGFGKNLSGASGAIKELTGGLIDLGQFAEDGADKVKAVGTLLATPFKLANTAVAKSTKIFTGKEVNFGQNLADWWGGTEKEINGETVKADGFKDRFLTSIPQAFASFGEGLKGVADGLYNGINNLGSNVANFASGVKDTVEKGITGAMEGVKTFGGKVQEMGTAFVDGAKNFAAGTRAFAMKAASFVAGLGRTAMALGRQAVAFAMALPGLIASGIAFAAGLIATAAGMLIAAAPFIGIGLLIGLAVAAVVMGVMFLVKNFESIKTTISEKVGGAIDKVKGFIQGFTDFFVNVWQSISDWVRGKILGIKKKLFGLSDEEQAELDGINERKEEKNKAKELKKEQEKQAEVQAEAAYQEMKENGELEGMNRREKRRLKRRLEKQELEGIQEEAKFQAQSSEELIASKEANYEMGTYLRNKESQKENELREAEKGIRRTKYIRNGEVLEGDAKEERIEQRLEIAQTKADEKYGTDRELNRGIERFDQAYIRDQEELLTREDYIPSKVVEDKDQIAADTLGVSKEDYLMMKAEDEENDFYGSVQNINEDDKARISAAIDREDGDRIKDAADRREEEAAKMGPPLPPVNMANNAVQQVNVSNNRKVIQDPAPHNPDPTGSRLSVVPA